MEEASTCITEKRFKNLIKSISAEKFRRQEKSIINIISRTFDITLMEKNDLKAEVIDLKDQCHKKEKLETELDGLEG